VADTKTSALTELAGASVVADDWIPIVDTSVTTTKKLNPLEIKDIPSLGLLPLVAGGAAVENIGAVESNVNTVATSGSTETLDTAVYAVHDVTMDQACTFTFSNPAPSGKNSTFVLILRGAFTPTFPASVDWGDASAPTYTTPSVYVFTTVDAGTIWLGSQVGKAFG
jgi:hypothetical protein